MFEQIREIYEQESDSARAAISAAYLQNKFVCLGIMTPRRREVSKIILIETKSFTRNQTLALVKKLWSQPEREFHYLGLEILVLNFSRIVQEEDIELLENLITTNSWWDSVDVVAPKLVPVYFKKFPSRVKQKTDEWVLSGNTWLIRTAILFQLKYKDKTNLDLLFQTILRTCSSNEFFINKAIGWVLRENAKRIPDEIYTFVNEHRHKLSNLSIREALKHKL